MEDQEVDVSQIVAVTCVLCIGIIALFLCYNTITERHEKQRKWLKTYQSKLSKV